MTDKDEQEHFLKEINHSEISPDLNKKARITAPELYENLKSLAPISIYQLSKKTEIPETTLRVLLNKLEMGGLIRFRVIINDQNRVTKLVCLIENGS